MVLRSICIATESTNGTTTYTPGPAILRNLPKRSSATCSHCAATRSVDASKSPAAAEPSTVNTLSHGDERAKTAAKPAANISRAKLYTPTRLASFSVMMLSGDSCDTLANATSACSLPRCPRCGPNLLIRTSPLPASPPPRRHPPRTAPAPCIALGICRSAYPPRLSRLAPRSRSS